MTLEQFTVGAWAVAIAGFTVTNVIIWRACWQEWNRQRRRL